MTKVLIVGAHTDGIGDEVARSIVVDNLVRFLPTIRDLNVADEDSVSDYIVKNGPFDQIVYSAGISRLSWIKDTTKGAINTTLDVNLVGAILVAARHVEAFPNHPVRYAVVVSDAAHTPMRGSIAYCASKAGLEMAVRCMARELAPTWTVVGVSPGVVENTGMTNQLAHDIPEFRSWTPEEAQAYESATSVLGRRVTKREVADAILYALKGPEALNGSIITINGGK